MSKDKKKIYNANGLDEEGYDKYGFDCFGYDRDGFRDYGRDCDGYLKPTSSELPTIATKTNEKNFSGEDEDWEEYIYYIPQNAEHQDQNVPNNAGITIPLSAEVKEESD